MGTYVCEAFNGIPPNDTQEFRVDVYCECKLTPALLAPHIVLLSFPDYHGGGDCSWRLPGPDHHSGVPGGVLAQGGQVSISTEQYKGTLLSPSRSYWEKEGRVLAADSKYNIVEDEEAIQYKFV